MQDFNSVTVTAKDRIEAWREFSDRHLAFFRTMPIGEHAFRIEAEAKRVGNLAMVRTAGSGHCSERTSYETGRQREHFYAFAVHVGDGGTLKSRYGSAALAPGDLALLSTMEEFALELERPYERISVKLPAHWLESRLRRPELLCGAVIRTNPAVASVLSEFLLSVYRQAHRLSPVASDVISTHILDLMSEVLSDRPATPPPSQAWRAALFDKACRLIARRCKDPDFRSEHLAGELGISLRMLQRIFAENEETVMQRVARERVGLAASMLIARDRYRSSITEIAFECGFSDLTTFGRTFAAQKGVAPSRWRKLEGSDGDVQQTERSGMLPRR